MEADANQLVLSAVAIWELRLKWDSLHVSSGRKRLIDPGTVVAFAAAMEWLFLPLTAHHAAAPLQQSLAHKDPFDELLLVQAQEEGMRLLTRDTKLSAHPITFNG